MSTSLILKNTTSAPRKRFCFRTKAALRNQNKKTYSHLLIIYVYIFVHGAHRACKIANKADQSCIFVSFGGSTRVFLQMFLSEPSRLFDSLTLGRTTIAPEEQFCSGVRVFRGAKTNLRAFHFVLVVSHHFNIRSASFLQHCQQPKSCIALYKVY